MPGRSRQSTSSRQKASKGRSGRTVKPSSLLTGSPPAEKVTISLPQNLNSSVVQLISCMENRG